MNSVLPSGGHVAQNTQQESHRSHLTSTRQTGRGNSSRDREEDEVGIESQRDRTGSTGGENEHGTTEMKSQYQKDFPPPSSCRRRRTPAHPQPDNIGINPAFGLESVCQCLSAVDRRRAAHQCLCFFFWFTGSSSAQSRERLTLDGPSWIPGMPAGWERPRPDNHTWRLSDAPKQISMCSYQQKSVLTVDSCNAAHL